MNLTLRMRQLSCGLIVILAFSAFRVEAVQTGYDATERTNSSDIRLTAPHDASGYSTAASPINQMFQDYNISQDAFGATVFSLLYGYPLTGYETTFRGGLGLAFIGTNRIYNLKKPAGPSDTTVVRPNSDTIYALSVIDLSSQDVVVSVPERQAERYYLFSFYDPYGDNYASLGTVNASDAGDYLLRPSLRTGDAGLSTKSCQSYKACINAPTLDGLLLIRVELKQNTTAELDYVNDFISRVDITTSCNHSQIYAPLSPNDLQDLSLSTPERVMQLTARFFARNPPQSLPFASAVEPILKSAGISPETGEYEQPPNVNLTEAGAMFTAITLGFYSDKANNIPLNNGWTVLSPDFSGSFQAGTDVVARAFVAQFGYLQNTPDQAIYPTAPERFYQLQNDEALLITFAGGKPPTKPEGFWSLTIYNSQSYLIANPIGRYELGDRNNITYPDGSLVYPNGSNDQDGSIPSMEPFHILVQSQDMVPPANWTSNWLPSPQGQESFQLTLRFFAPTGELVYGYGDAYVYPKIERVAALTSQ